MGRLKKSLAKREQDIASGNFPSLDLKESDPVRWEILYTRIAGTVQNAKEVAKRISASPVVREMGECIFGVFTPEGDSVAFSDGLLIHISSIGSAIKWMIKNDFEEVEKIRDGDLFFNNDPHLGGGHSPDQLLVTPIFHNKRIVGWAGGLTHVPETGATEAGGSPPNAVSRYDEGIYWPCVRVGERGKLNRNMERIVERGTRSPVWWLLDQRAKLAGIQLIKNATLELIDEFGVDYYTKAANEYIEDTRRAALKRIPKLFFPGKYRSIVMTDVANEGKPIRYPVNTMARVALEMRIGPNGELRLDFDGTSSPGRHAYNAALPSLIGNVMNWGMQSFLYDVKYNHGLAQALANPSILYAPDNCCINTTDLSYATSLFLVAFNAFNGMNMAGSRAHYAMGFREMVQAGHAFVAGLRCGGTDQYGRPVGGALFEYTALGMPGTPCYDGPDTSYIMFNPASDCSDAEQWERVFPLMYLGRRIHRDGGGYGKYRGGASLESLFAVVNSTDVTLATMGSSCRAYNAPGIMGGYPGCTNYKYLYLDTNLKEVAEAGGATPSSEGIDPAKPEWMDMLQGRGILTDVPALAMSFNPHDLCHAEIGGAGGYGDPIERDPDQVRKDLQLELTTPRTAEKVNCVKIDPKTIEVDREATRRLRDDRRRERLAKGMPVRDYVAASRDRILRGDIPDVSKRCLNDCMRRSEKFLAEFQEGWGLPADFRQIP